jgi:hypothetical protein
MSVIAVTVDNQTAAGRERSRAVAGLTRDCSACHSTEPVAHTGASRTSEHRYHEAAGGPFSPPDLGLRRQIARNHVDENPPEGHVTHEDAALAKYGVDGVTPNHGGRGERASALRSRPSRLSRRLTEDAVLVDSGFRRGTDIFKALARASAVCVGHLRVGLAAFGQASVSAASRSTRLN